MRAALKEICSTTALRLTVRYVMLYGLVLGAAFAACFFSARLKDHGKIQTHLEKEMLRLSQQFETQGVGSLSQQIVQISSRRIENRQLYLLQAADGKKLAGDLIRWPREAEIPVDGKVHEVWLEEEVFPREIYDDDVLLPVIAKRFSDGTRLLIAQRALYAKELKELTDYLQEVLGTAVILSVILGLSLTRTILRRMDTVRRSASEIMRGDLSQRIPISKRNDEFDALAIGLNVMLDRIQKLLQAMREVTDNVAHDLRSPLTRMRTGFEIALLEPRTTEEYREVISRGIEETTSLMKTFNALLGIARLEAGNFRPEQSAINLDELLVDLVDLYRPLAEEKNQRLTLDLGAAAETRGSRDLLAQALSNLLDNAIKYTPADGEIRVTTTLASPYVVVSIRDSGPGIPEAEHDHVLERFVRLETSRSTAGDGLGLSLVKAVATLHSATLHLEDGCPGLMVSLCFPNSKKTE